MFKRLIIPGLCAVSAFAQTIKSDDVLTEKKLTLELSQGPIGITAALAGPAAGCHTACANLGRRQPHHPNHHELRGARQ